NIQKTGYRVYEDGYIGVAGGIGTPDLAALEQEAVSNLSLKIPYEEEVSKAQKVYRDRREIEFDEVDFIQEVEGLLSYLRETYPNFSFSNKINMEEMCVKLENDQEVSLCDRDLMITVMLLVREKSSVNVFDTGVVQIDREWNIKKIRAEVARVVGSYTTEVELPHEGKLPVILDLQLVEPKLRQELNGESVGRGSSLFKDCMGEQKFHPDFTYGQNMKEGYMAPFFDAEGYMNTDYTYNFIENGKIIAPYTDKKTARLYGLQHTGSSTCEYDGTPTLNIPDSYVKPSERTLKELLNGELGVLVVMAGGGDYTPEGHFGYPVQHAILTDGEKMLGRLPLINIASNLYEMFGKDYRGCTKDVVKDNMRCLVMDMQVSLA
ncbi:MAG: metallopeptidase TldD-related protein, partial [Niameybacter sp.]